MDKKNTTPPSAGNNNDVNLCQVSLQRLFTKNVLCYIEITQWVGINLAQFNKGELK